MADTTTGLGDAQQAMYSLLTADAPLMAAISGVFDYVPDEQPFPYLVIGDGTALDWDTFDTIGDDLTVNLHIWSRAYGFSECNAITGAIRRILHRKPLPLTSHTSVLCLWDYSDNQNDPDGMTRHGICRFHILMQAPLS